VRLLVLFTRKLSQHCLAENRPVFENSVRKCLSQRCGFMVSDRTMGPIILVETYSVPTLTSCNGTSWVNMGFVADQYLHFYELFLFTELEPVFTAEFNECGACFSIIHTKGIPVHKLAVLPDLCLEFNHSCLKRRGYVLLFCLFPYCIKWNLLLENLLLICELCEFTRHFF
jgi:hypothetical protein